MILMIEASALAAALNAAKRIIPTRAADIKTECVLLTVDGKDTLTVSAFSGDEAVNIALSLDGPHEPGSAMVLCKTLLDIVNVLPVGLVSLAYQEDKGNNALTVAWSTGNAIIPVYNETFPEIKKPEEATVVIIDAGALRLAVGKTVSFAADDPIRPPMASVLLEFSAAGVATSVGTDAHVLVSRDCSMNAGIDAPVSVLVPKATGEDLLALLEGKAGDVRLTIGQRKVVAEFGDGDIVFSCTPTMGKYPNWRSILPKDNDKKLVADRKELIGAIKRIGTAYTGYGQGVIAMALEEGKPLCLTADNLVSNIRTKEKLDVEYTGDPLSVSFKVECILPLLSSFDEERVELTLKSERTSIVVKGVDAPEGAHVGLIMPVQGTKK